MGDRDARMMEKGLFIAFEGIDGSGKSTQIKKLVEFLFDHNKHHHIILTREPYLDQEIRSILREDQDPHSQAEKLADLFITDRKIHVEQLILPNLQKGHLVISDRYKLSTITYQSAQGLSMSSLIDRHLGLPVPDVTFFIDIPVEIAIKRMERDVDRKEHKFEASADFLHTLRDNHHRARVRLHGENIVTIDGDRDPEVIFNDIKEHIVSLLQKADVVEVPAVQPVIDQLPPQETQLSLNRDV